MFTKHISYNPSDLSYHWPHACPRECKGITSLISLLGRLRPERAAIFPKAHHAWGGTSPDDLKQPRDSPSVRWVRVGAALAAEPESLGLHFRRPGSATINNIPHVNTYNYRVHTFFLVPVWITGMAMAEILTAPMRRTMCSLPRA